MFAVRKWMETGRHIHADRDDRKRKRERDYTVSLLNIISYIVIVSNCRIRLISCGRLKLNGAHMGDGRLQLMTQKRKKSNKWAICIFFTNVSWFIFRLLIFLTLMISDQGQTIRDLASFRVRSLSLSLSVAISRSRRNDDWFGAMALTHLSFFYYFYFTFDYRLDCVIGLLWLGDAMEYFSVDDNMIIFIDISFIYCNCVWVGKYVLLFYDVRMLLLFHTLYSPRTNTIRFGFCQLRIHFIHTQTDTGTHNIRTIFSRHEWARAHLSTLSVVLLALNSKNTHLCHMEINHRTTRRQHQQQ